MPIDVEGLKGKYGKDAKTPPKKPEEPIVEMVEPLIKEKKNDIKIEQETITEQEYRKELINDILKKKILKKGINNMANKKKEDRIKKAKGQFESVKSGGSDSNTQQNTSNESIADAVRRAIQEEIPKLLKSGKLDPSSFINSNARVDQPIDVSFASMEQSLKSIYQGNQSSLGNNGGNMNIELLKILYEMQNLIRNIPQNNKQADKQENMLMAYILKKQESGNSGIINTILTNVFQQNASFQEAFMRLNSGQQQGDPRITLREDLKFFREMSGDKRAQTKDEMHYGIEKKKLEIQEYARRDMLDREERVAIRDDQKSERFMNIGETVLQKVIGDGLGNLVSELMSVKGSGGSKGKKAPPTQQGFDPSLLDDEL